MDLNFLERSILKLFPQVPQYFFFFKFQQPSLKRRFQTVAFPTDFELSVANPTLRTVSFPTAIVDIRRKADTCNRRFSDAFLISVAYSTAAGVAYPTPYGGYFSKKNSTIENILSLKRHFTFNRRLCRCRLSDGSLSVG